MGRRLVQLADHPAHLLQLLHQVVLGMQASGGIGDQHVDAAGLGGLHRVEDHRGGVGAGVLGDHRDAVALAPDLQLLHGGGAEGVAGGQHDLLPSSCSFFASLPMVVVLPTPFTPTTRIT